MRSSLRRVWGQRLKWKRLKEKIFLSWVESIAEAAKQGGSDQQELDWDSYEKIQQKLYLQQLQQAAEKKRAKEMAKRAKKAAKDNEELAILKALKLKQRLMKLDRKTSINGQVASQGDMVMTHISALEKLDLELIKREKMRTEVSFADQIRAAKNKKLELATAASSSADAVNEQPGE